MFCPSARASKFSTQMHQLFIIKICYTIKVNSICGASQDTRSLHHKFNSQGPALRFLGVTVPCPRVPVPGSWMSGSSVPGSQNQRFPGPRVSGPWSQDLGSQGPRPQGQGSHGLDPGSQVLILDYVIFLFHYPHFCLSAW